MEAKSYGYFILLEADYHKGYFEYDRRRIGLSATSDEMESMLGASTDSLTDLGDTSRQRLLLCSSVISIVIYERNKFIRLQIPVPR